jgi:hypothetical protein
LEAVRYYNIYLPFFADVVIQLDETDSAAIKACQPMSPIWMQILSV